MDRDLQLNTTRIRRDRWPPSIGMHGRVQSESSAGGFWILRTGRTGMGWTATLDGIKRAKRGSDEVATGADLMTGEQSRYLEVGDRVCWGVTTTDLGTVVGTSWSGVTIAWDDGHTTPIQHNDMAKVERIPTKLI